MITVLFRDEMDQANLDVAIGQLAIPNDVEIENFLDSEICYTITELKNNIIYRTGDRGVVEFKKTNRFAFQITQSTPQKPTEGALKLLNRLPPRGLIYTIGYGNRDIVEFIDLLKKYEIQFVIDVRSAAYSKYNEAYSYHPLQEILKENGIKYVSMGEQLGGRPKDDSCYTDGKVDYGKVATKAFYQAGIDRLKTALQKQLQIVLMCSELKPEQCHRTKLIGQTLDDIGIELAHIDETGIVRNQTEIIDRLTNGQLSMFEPNFTSNKSYR